MSRLPTLFIPHGGGPCFFRMDWDPPDTWGSGWPSICAEYQMTLGRGQGAGGDFWPLGRESRHHPKQSRPTAALYHHYGFPPKHVSLLASLPRNVSPDRSPNC